MSIAFVTGTTGFIGGALARELLARGWRVRGLVRGTRSRRPAGCEDPGFVPVEGDLRDPSTYRDGLEGCDVLFHAAARYSLWNPRPREIYEDNVEGTRRLLDLALELKIGRVVHTSSVGVFELPADGAPADETCTAPLEKIRGHYKRSKWLAEACARDFAARGLPVVIVNPSTPVGPWDVKPTPTGRMVLDLLLGRMPAYTDSGLNLVDIDDVARGHLLAAERGRDGESYILGGENIHLREILTSIAAMAGVKPPRWQLPRSLLMPLSFASSGWALLTRTRPRIPWEAAVMAQKHMFFKDDRARRELGYSPGDPRGALQRAVDWFNAQGYTNVPSPKGLVVAR